jgi:MarR family transcriptional repressor of emrRAB
MASARPRLENLLASLSLNLAEEAANALERITGLTGSAPLGLLALEEFLDGSSIGRLADALGITHSGSVRVVSQLEAKRLVVRRVGADRRCVEVRLTARGRRRAYAARAARDAILRDTTSGLDDGEAAALERLLTKLIEARVSARVADLRAGSSTSWWCRTCDFSACGRSEGRCPAHLSAARNAQR